MEDEEKIEEEINQEKTKIKYQCPGVPKINMDAPMDKSYEMVLLNLEICSIISD